MRMVLSWKTIYDAWGDRRVCFGSHSYHSVVAVSAGFDGTQFKGLLASRFDIQLNKTSRNSVLLQTNINNTRSDIAYLIKVFSRISHAEIGSQASRLILMRRRRFDGPA